MIATCSDEFVRLPVSINATLFQPVEMKEYLERAGFNIDVAHVLEPYDFELQTQRLYFLATKVA